MDTVYLTHPVLPEIKAEVRARGAKIIDAAFAPADAAIHDGQTGEAIREAGEAPPSGFGPFTREDIAEMKREDVIELLELHGVEKPKGKIEDLRAQLIAVMFVEA